MRCFIVPATQFHTKAPSSPAALHHRRNGESYCRLLVNSFASGLKVGRPNRRARPISDAHTDSTQQKTKSKRLPSAARLAGRPFRYVADRVALSVVPACGNAAMQALVHVHDRGAHRRLPGFHGATQRPFVGVLNHGAGRSGNEK